MGSTNPVFLLSGALKERAETIAQGMKNSATLGSGQFCTCPGLTVGIHDEHFAKFVTRLEGLIAGASPAAMLHAGIQQSYAAGVSRLGSIEGVRGVQSTALPDTSKSESRPAMFVTDFNTFEKHRELGQELFGPSTVIVGCRSYQDMKALAENLEGHLTATIHGTPEDLAEHAGLVSILENKVGRLIFNGFPTGVEVCASMQHGGPYPATTDSRTTSVGTAAILRFTRPIAYQNFPQAALPRELQDANPRGIWRLVDDRWTKEAL
jgi:NADP-dependent aldehyde dehydrogenase